MRTNEDGREADVRLANYRLQPLGHLTAARNLSMRQALSYEEAAVPKIVPEIVPATSQKRRLSGTVARAPKVDPKAAVL